MEVDRLLAKSHRKDAGTQVDADACTLLGHTKNVYNAAAAVLAASGDDQLEAMGLPTGSWRRRLDRIVLFAALMHDLGKANDQFQRVVRGDLQRAQAIRHEWILYLILNGEPWRQWSQAAIRGPVEDWHLALWCIVGHHPGRLRESPPKRPPSGTGTSIRVHLDHPDFLAVVDWIANTLGVLPPPRSPFRDLRLTGVSSEAHRAIKSAFRADQKVWRHTGEEERRFVAAAKACLIAADVAGSTLVQDRNPPVEEHIRSSLRTRPSGEALEELIVARLAGAAPLPFQNEIARSRSRVTLVQAGCGTGKTTAAYLWAARQWTGRRIYFCYPTTGTATEGFRGYLYDAELHQGYLGARLSHSRAAIDTELLLGVSGDADDEEHAYRAEALNTWSAPVTACTADTVLGITQNHRRGLFAWPALAQSAFIFDEIHAYDEAMFGSLLRFIDGLRGIPVLLMTASLPAGYRLALERRLVTIGEQLSPPISGPVELERLPRYRRFETVDPLSFVSDELAAGGKVLWVCNTVRRALAVAEQATNRNLDPLVYHSRFRYEDRVRRHAALIHAFDEAGAALAVCTQVAEMSLDISASMLITDLAPITAVIQRLGRLNRRASTESPLGRFAVTTPEGTDGRPDVLPYDEAALESTKQWLETLGNVPLSQVDLVQAWRNEQSSEEPAPVASTWLDGGPSTCVGDIREGSPGISVLLSSDAHAVASGQVPLQRVALPMGPPPERLNWRAWNRIRGMHVVPADAIDYDEKRGGQWRNA